MNFSSKFLKKVAKVILYFALFASLVLSFNLAFAQRLPPNRQPPGPATNKPPGPTTNQPPGTNSPGGGTNIPNYDTVVGNFDNPIKSGSITELLFSLMHGFLLTIAVLAVAVIIYGGFQMIISAGNEKLLTSGKRAVTWAILGLIVALLSYSIVSIVENFIGVKPPG